MRRIPQTILKHKPIQTTAYFANKIVLKYIHLHDVYSFFHARRTELKSFDQYLMANKDQSLFCLALESKSLLSCVLDTVWG